jgi:hypothetical protein
MDNHIRPLGVLIPAHCEAVVRRKAKNNPRAIFYRNSRYYGVDATRVLNYPRLFLAHASITNKLKRGTFSATFMLACLAALELEGLRLEDI